MHMIDSKWNHLKGVGLREHYNRSTCLKHQKSAPGVDTLWRQYTEQNQTLNLECLRSQYNKNPPD